MTNVLTDLNERRALLRSIIPKVPVATKSGKTARKGGLMWEEYFKEHPDQAHLLGYDVRKTQTRIWATNAQLYRWIVGKVKSRYTGKLIPPKPFGSRNGLLPYKVAVPKDPEIDKQDEMIANRDKLIQTLEGELKELKTQLKAAAAKGVELETELHRAKLTIAELAMQLRT